MKSNIMTAVVFWGLGIFNIIVLIYNIIRGTMFDPDDLKTKETEGIILPDEYKKMFYVKEVIMIFVSFAAGVSFLFNAGIQVTVTLGVAYRLYEHYIEKKYRKLT